MAASPHQGGTRRWAALAVVLVATFSTTLDMGSVTIGFPTFSAVFAAPLTTVLWVGVGYFLVAAGLQFTMGWLGDGWGRRRVFVLGFLVISLGFILSSLAKDIFQLIAFRMVTAVGAAMLQANYNAIVAENFPRESLGRPLGIMSAVQGLGLASGPPLGGWLLELLGWPSLFYARLPLSLGGALMAWLVLPARPRRKGLPAPDLPGGAALFFGFGGLLLALNQLRSAGLGSPLVWAPAALAILCLAAFPYLERRAAAPVVPPSLLRNPGFLSAQAGYCLHWVVWGAVMFLTPYYLVSGLGYSPGMAGLLLAAFPAVRILLSPLGGTVSDRVGVKLPAVVGMGLMAAGLLAWSRLGATPGGAIVVVLLLAGAGSALFEPVSVRAVLETAPREQVGTASASVPTTRQLSSSVGGTVGGSLFSIRQTAHQGGTSPGQAVAAGYSDVLLVLAGFALAAMVVFLLRPDRREGGRREDG